MNLSLCSDTVLEGVYQQSQRSETEFLTMTGVQSGLQYEEALEEHEIPLLNDQEQQPIQFPLIQLSVKRSSNV